jgi:hypothetical protein
VNLIVNLLRRTRLGWTGTARRVQLRDDEHDETVHHHGDDNLQHDDDGSLSGSCVPMPANSSRGCAPRPSCCSEAERVLVVLRALTEILQMDGAKAPSRRSIAVLGVT